MDLIIHNVTRLVIRTLIVLITCILIYSLAEFVFLAGKAAFTQHAAFNFSPEPIDRSKLFFTQVQGLIAAVLLITILIELIYSLVEYLKVGSANYVTVITTQHRKPSHVLYTNVACKQKHKNAEH